ncbi:MAG TPA: hypothetical protein VIC32_02660 [Terriglobales bacterium]
MAELTPRLRGQLAAIANARWRLMVNSVRTTRGAMELVARIWVGFWFAVLALGAGIGSGFAAWYFVSTGHAERMAIILWIAFVFWQVFPLAASAFTEHVDSSYLARYPLSYRAYAVIRVAFGTLDVATLVGSMVTLGLAIGVAVARPGLLLVALPAFIGFALFNILLAQMIFAWLERWLAQRRTREVLGVLFLLLIFGFNFIGPIIRRMNRSHAGVAVTLQQLRAWLPLERWLPPGMPAHAIAAAATASIATSLAALAGLWAVAAVIFSLLHLRLRAEYLGENLSESAVSAPAPRRARTGRAAATAPSSSRRFGGGPVAAIAQKELRYLLRSPMMFFTLVVPVIMIFFIRGGMQGGGRPGGFHLQTTGLGFPIGVAYALLVLTGLIYNTMATDTGGVQFYFLAPVPFRQVMLGKNLAYALILAFEAVLLYVATVFIDGPPTPELLAYTLLGLVFATLCDFSCGNLLSLTMPKKINLARLGRQSGRGTSSLIAIALQAALLLLIVIAVAGGAVLRQPLLTLGLLLLLIAAAVAVYRIVLGRCDAVALAHRETLTAELAKG